MTNCMRKGFTLIELCVCLVVLVLISGTVTLSLRSLSNRMTAADVIDQLSILDRKARQRSVALGTPVLIAFDLDQQTATLVAAESKEPLGGATPLRFSTDTQVQRLQVGRRWYDSGQAAVPCSATGCTPSYALELGTRGTTPWSLFCAGLSGQIVAFEPGDSAYDAHLALLQTGNDTD